jgi:methionyl-tRNA formyltransferase
MTKKDLRIVFMGTPDFAVASLDALHKDDYQIVGVVTTADKKAGRGKKTQIAAVKKYALEHNLRVMTPLNLKDPEFLSELSSLKADLQIVVAFRMLPKVVWNAPPLGTFNLHASLLPQYRGAAPINHAIINGEKETGVTTFFLDEKIDTGRIIMQKTYQISETETAGELHYQLMQIGAALVVETVEHIVKGDLTLLEQSDIAEETQLKAAPKIFKEDGKIDWNEKAEIIFNKIRGLSPYPAAWTKIKAIEDEPERSLKIFSVKKTDIPSSHSPGYLSSDVKKHLRIATKDFDLDILELQLQAKKRLKIADFLRGFSFVEGMQCQ